MVARKIRGTGKREILREKHTRTLIRPPRNPYEVNWRAIKRLPLFICIQGGREISVIIVTGDYLYYKEPKRPYNFFFLISIFNELFKFKTSDERQH